MMPTRLRRSDDPFLTWLRGIHLGQPSDRQRWLAWVAMVALMGGASRPDRARWHRYFARLSAIEDDESLSESERGAAFIALLNEARPVPARRGRPREDDRGLLADFPAIRDMLAPAWPKAKGAAARAAAVAAVERRAPELRLTREHRRAILALGTPSLAARTILSHAYGDNDTNPIDMALKRARRRASGS